MVNKVNHIGVIKFPGALDIDDILLPADSESFEEFKKLRPQLYSSDNAVFVSYKRNGLDVSTLNELDVPNTGITPNNQYDGSNNNLFSANGTVYLNSGVYEAHPEYTGRLFSINPLMPKLKSHFDANNVSFVCDIGSLVEPIRWARWVANTRVIPVYGYALQKYPALAGNTTPLPITGNTTPVISAAIEGYHNQNISISGYDDGFVIGYRKWNDTFEVGNPPLGLASHNTQQILLEVGVSSDGSNNAASRVIAFGALGRFSKAVADKLGISQNDILRKKTIFNISSNYRGTENSLGAAVTIDGKGDTLKNKVDLFGLNEPNEANSPNYRKESMGINSPRSVYYNYPNSGFSFISNRIETDDIANSIAIEAEPENRFYGVERYRINLAGKDIYANTTSDNILFRSLLDREKNIVLNQDSIKVDFSVPASNTTGFTIDIDYTNATFPNNENAVNGMLDVFGHRKTFFANTSYSNTMPIVCMAELQIGNDTHTNQAETFVNRLGSIDDDIDELILKLKELEIWDETAIILASEFGRTWSENSSGTDHGWRGVAIVLGGAIKGGEIFYGEPEDANQPLGPMTKKLNQPSVIDNRGRAVPRLAWDQLYAGIFVEAGLTEAELVSTGVIPTLEKFNNYPGTSSPIIPIIA